MITLKLILNEIFSSSFTEVFFKVFYYERKTHLLEVKWGKVTHFLIFESVTILHRQAMQQHKYKGCNYGSSAVKNDSKLLAFSCQTIAWILKLIGLNVLLVGCIVPGDLVG